ncbi:cytochrome c oxidase assembly protein [Luedemannella flava]|uniref:Cytochrome c oxidase assembly protein n=1 Tax=Luedemannella flava TaxID=349316 RepID=A0ABP4Y9F9_9ACTN
MTPPAEQWTDVVGVVAVAALGAAYGRGVHELWARRGHGAVVPSWRAGAFVLGLAIVLVAQQGPVHDAAERSLAGHMAQHMLLMLGAAPLLAAGCAGLPVTLATPRPLRQVTHRVRTSAPARWLRRPLTAALVAAGVHTVVLWAWHLPLPYEWAEASAPVHAVEHASMVGAAWLLWAGVVAPASRRLSPPIGLLMLFAAGMPAAALGAVLTFAPEPIYDVPSGPRALADQQLAGLVMWIPMDVLMLVAAVVLFLGWLADLERRSPAGRDLRPGLPEEVPT